MQVKDIMTRDVEIARRDTLLTDVSDQVLGVITDRDITVRAAVHVVSMPDAPAAGVRNVSEARLLWASFLPLPNWTVDNPAKRNRRSCPHFIARAEIHFWEVDDAGVDGNVELMDTGKVGRL